MQTLWNQKASARSVAVALPGLNTKPPLAMSILTDLLSGIAEFVADLFVFRRQRERHGSTTRSVGEDAVELARFDFLTMLWIALVTAGLTCLLIFGVGLPVGWGLGIGLAVGLVWAYRRYMQLVRE